MISSSATAQIEFGIKGGLNFNYANNETYLIEGVEKVLNLHIGKSVF